MPSFRKKVTFDFLSFLIALKKHNFIEVFSTEIAKKDLVDDWHIQLLRQSMFNHVIFYIYIVLKMQFLIASFQQIYYTIFGERDNFAKLLKVLKY